MDMILFVADKIEWDQDGVPPYADDIESAVNISLGLAAFIYIRYIWNNNSKLKVVHPWMKEAYEELSRQLRGEIYKGVYHSEGYQYL